MLIVTRCGHVYHEACLESPGCCERVAGEQQWTCYKCSRGRGSVSAPQRVHRSISSSQPLSPPFISRVDVADVSVSIVSLYCVLCSVVSPCMVSTRGSICLYVNVSQEDHPSKQGIIYEPVGTCHTGS